MNYESLVKADAKIDFGNMEESFFLIGMMNEFMNRYQVVADQFFQEISWKQCFVLICMQFFKQPPTIKELSEVMGCSHQNLKQMLNKLEKVGFVTLTSDQSDRRKQRIYMTEKAGMFCKKNEQPSKEVMKTLFDGISREEIEVTIQTIAKMDEQLKRMKPKEMKL